MSGNGWMLLVFDPTIYDDWNYSNVETEAYNLQTYVFAKYNYAGYSTSVEATVMSNVYWADFFGGPTGQEMPYFNTYDGFNGVYE
jgi:hypothetical protein